MRKIILNREIPLEIYDELIELGREEYKKYSITKLSKLIGINRHTLTAIIHKKDQSRSKANITGSNRFQHILYLLDSVGVSVRVNIGDSPEEFLITDSNIINYIKEKAISLLIDYKQPLASLERAYNFPKDTLKVLRKIKANGGILTYSYILEIFGQPVYLLLNEKK